MMERTYEIKVAGKAPVDVGNDIYEALKAFEIAKTRNPNRPVQLITKYYIVLKEGTYDGR